MTHETSVSLLEGLRREPSETAWRRLVEIYEPLVRSWLVRRGAQGSDADDVAQETLVVVVRKLPAFERERTGSFRRWLLGITTNCLREHWRSRRTRTVAEAGSAEWESDLAQLADPQSDLSRLWDEEHDRHVTRVLLERIRPNFEPATWEAFERVVLRGQTASATAAALGTTVNAVFIAKSRIMTQLRTLGAGLLD